MARDLENYIPVADRLKTAQAEHKGLVVKSKVEVSWADEAALVKVTLELDGKIMAEAHALAGDLSEDKALEKAETSAVGRALANMGYPGEDEGASESKSEKKTSKGGLGGGLGKKSSKKSKDEEEESEESEDESEEEQEEEKPASKKSGLPGLGSKKTSSKKDEESEEESEEESSDEDEEQEEKQAPKKSSGASSKLSGVMAKYGLK